jgi:hypothetical protein
MPSSRGEIDDPRLMWERTRDPSWIWRVIGHCIRCGAPFPDWVLNYMGRSAEAIEKIKITDIRSDDIKRVIRQAVDRGVIVCSARWPGFDLGRKEWTIPAARMKKTKDGAKPFMVPLTDAMLDALNALPRFSDGDFLFSHNFDKRPLRSYSFSDPKERLDG